MEANGAALGHQGPAPEGRPDRRLSRAVECMVAIKNSGATSRSGQISARPPPIRSRNLGKTSRRSPSTPAVGMRPSGLGSGRSPSSTFLRASRTVGSLRPMAGHPSRRRGPGYRLPSRHKDIVRSPADMSFEADGLKRPDHLIVEMARWGVARRLTLANSSAISRVRRPNLKGLWRAPSRCHRSGSYSVRPIGGSKATRTSRAHGTKYSTWGRGYPKTRGQGRRRDGRPLTIFAF
jgi:hypothetical protein